MISKLLSSKIEAVPFYKKCYNCLIWDLIIDLYSRIQKVNVKIMEFCTLQFFIAPQYNFLCLLSEAEHWGVSTLKCRFLFYILWNQHKIQNSSSLLCCSFERRKHYKTENRTQTFYTDVKNKFTPGFKISAEKWKIYL